MIARFEKAVVTSTADHSAEASLSRRRPTSETLVISSSFGESKPHVRTVFRISLHSLSNGIEIIHSLGIQDCCLSRLFATVSCQVVRLSLSIIAVALGGEVQRLIRYKYNQFVLSVCFRGCRVCVITQITGEKPVQPECIICPKETLSSVADCNCL